MPQTSVSRVRRTTRSFRGNVCPDWYSWNNAMICRLMLLIGSGRAPASSCDGLDVPFASHLERALLRFKVGIQLVSARLADDESAPIMNADRRGEGAVAS